MPANGATETFDKPMVEFGRANTEAGGTAIADLAIDTPRYADRARPTRGGSGSRFVGEAGATGPAAALFSLTSTWPPTLARLPATDLRGAIMRICEVRLEQDGIVTTVPLDPDRARSIF